MRFFMISAGLALAVSAHAGRSVDLGPLPVWDSLDTEVSTNVSFAVGRPQDRFLTFDLELHATPSNNVQVAFGRDADNDGELSVSETALVVGWDSGEWVVSGPRPQDVFRSPAQTTNAIKRLQWSLYEGLGSPRRLAATENDMPIPSLDGSRPPDWFFDQEWNLLRLTVRGTDIPGESFRAWMTAPGTRITIR